MATTNNHDSLIILPQGDPQNEGASDGLNQPQANIPENDTARMTTALDQERVDTALRHADTPSVETESNYSRAANTNENGGWSKRTKRLATLITAATSLVAGTGLGYTADSLFDAHAAAAPTLNNQNPSISSTPNKPAKTSTSIDLATNTAVVVAPPTANETTTPASETALPTTSQQSSPDIGEYSKIDQKYVINEQQANQDPEKYFSTLASSLGMRPSIMTADEVKTFNYKETAQGGDPQGAAAIADKIQGKDIENALNILLVNKKLHFTPEMQQAFNHQIYRYFLLSTDTVNVNQTSLVQEINKFVAQSKTNDAVNVSISDITIGANMDDNFLSLSIDSIDKNTGEPTSTMGQLGYIRANGIGVSVGPISNGLSPDNQPQILYF